MSHVLRIATRASVEKLSPLTDSASLAAGVEKVNRGDRGLTTLEWLLIVAAVAGLAALAVVLVQNVVDETAEEISGNNARETAAKVAALRIDSEAREEITENIVAGKAFDAGTLKTINSDYESKCDRLNITYSDVGIDTQWMDFDMGSTTTAASQKTKLEGNGQRCTIS